MDIDRTPLTGAEQDWIDKYRAALDNNLVRLSRLSRVQNKLSGVWEAFASGIKRIVGSQRDEASAATANSNLPAAYSKPPALPSEMRKPIAPDAIPTNNKRSKRGRKVS